MKAALKWGGISGAGLITLFILFRIGVVLKDIILPPKPILPTVDFGKVPPIPFGDPVITGEFSYTIDTLTGELPALPDRINVYKTVYPPTTLLNADRAKRKAQSINFIDTSGRVLDYTTLTPTVFQWQKEYAGGTKTLTMDIETYDFTVKTGYLSIPNIPNVNYADEQAKTTVRDFLNAMGSFPPDVDPTKTRIQFLSVKEGTLVPAPSFSKTQTISVNLFQKNIEEYPMVYPRYPLSTMNFLVAGRNANTEDVIDANFKHIIINTEEPGIYPIKTAQTAFEELEQGKAFMANYYGSKKNIAITDVYLAYFLGEQHQDYVMPVIVFHGDGDFYAFVSAVNDEWIGVNEPTTAP